MHFDDGQIPAEYSRHIRQKTFFIAAGLLLAGAMLITSIGMGPGLHLSPGSLADIAWRYCFQTF